MTPTPKYAMTRTRVIAEWASKHEPVRLWLNKLFNAKEAQALLLWYFCDWTKKTPEELLALKKGYESLEVERLLDLFTVDAVGYPESTRWKTVSSVRSFYRHNYKELHREAGKMDVPAFKQPRKPSKDQRRKLYEACQNPRDRALFCVTTCSAIALETLSNLRWIHFEEDWQQQELPHISLPAELLKGHGRGKYRGVRQETFITPETKRELQKYRGWMTKKHGVFWNNNMPVFLTVEGKHGSMGRQAIACTILQLSKDAEVPYGTHDGRRIVETALENINVVRNLVQKIKGRKVRGEDAPYSGPAIEQLRRKYQECLPELEFLNPTPTQAMSTDQALVFEKLTKVLERYPDKAAKFERFLMDL